MLKKLFFIFFFKETQCCIFKYHFRIILIFLHFLNFECECQKCSLFKFSFQHRITPKTSVVNIYGRGEGSGGEVKGCHRRPLILFVFLKVFFLNIYFEILISLSLPLYFLKILKYRILCKFTKKEKHIYTTASTFFNRREKKVRTRKPKANKDFYMCRGRGIVFFFKCLY